MNPDWRKVLEGSGASIENDVTVHFGAPGTELEAARSGSVLADLSHMGALDLTGEDAQSFLQGQLTCDVNSLDAGTSTFGGYCSASGRLLANFLLWRTKSGLRMLLPRSIAAATQQRLARYVLRAKVKISDASDELVLLGAAGRQAHGTLGAALGDIPAEAHRVRDFEVDGPVASVLALPGGRFLILAEPARALRLQAALCATLRPVGAPCWEWLDIRGGLPWITAPTQEQLIPQMANLELVGGVSFQKGCYPGQEIVARTQYRGKLKRRMYLANAARGDAPAAGDDLFSDDLPGQASGLVLNAQRSPEGGHDLLAVTQIESRANSRVHLRAPDGPELRFLELPYPLG